MQDPCASAPPCTSGHVPASEAVCCNENVDGVPCMPVWRDGGPSHTSLVVDCRGEVMPCDADSDCPTGEVCVWSECTATDTCSGDSGGPVYVEVDGTTYLVGIVSRGVENSLTYCGEGGIYTLANFYEDWMVSKGQTLYPPEDTGARLPAPSGPDASDDGATAPDADDAGCNATGGETTPAWPLLLLMLLAPTMLRQRRAVPLTMSSR